MSAQKHDKKDLDLVSANDQELSEDQLEEVSGGTPNNSQNTPKKQGTKQQDFLIVTMKEVFISG